MVAELPMAELPIAELPVSELLVAEFPDAELHFYSLQQQLVGLPFQQGDLAPKDEGGQCSR